MGFSILSVASTDEFVALNFNFSNINSGHLFGFMAGTLFVKTITTSARATPPVIAHSTSAAVTVTTVSPGTHPVAASA